MLIRKPSDRLSDRLADAATTVQRAAPQLPPANRAMRSPEQRAKRDVKQSPLDGIKSDGVVVIGKGTRIVGDISDCMRVEIRGALEGNIIADAVAIREGGGFRGTIQTDQAEVQGMVEGTITVHELLDVGSNGTVIGEVTYGRLTIADGGTVAGNIRTKKQVAAANPTADNRIELNDEQNHDCSASQLH